jgi:pimeloyl-ACP methyl ester carboxylesterase
MGDPELFVDAAGDGPAVLLGHGLGGSARNWRPQLRALRPAYRAVAWDARGHARSQAPVEEAAYTPERLVADLGRVLDAQSVDEPAVVGGLSLGAAVALRFALASPDRLRALVLAAYPGTRSGGGFAAVAEEFAAAIDAEGLEAAGDRFVWGARSGLDPQAAKLVRMGFLEHPPHTIAALLRQFVGPLEPVESLASELGRFARPTLVIVGGNDASSLGPSRALAALLPQAELVIVPDAGHVVNLARPEAFNEALLAFLERTAG